MDTLDNANANPFVLNNSNSDIILQKEGLLLDLAKQNGDPTTNGKRSADEEFDYGEDMGPETDVDQIDDVLMSPVSNKHLDNKKEEEKATLEIEHVKDEPAKLPAREDASTPPADLVHDTSGLIDNVAESCEDSDDEWNYYKGDTADKENIEPSDTDKEVCDIIDNDEMSHLNPNAAEFVPLSPKTRTESPALQALRDEPIIAQSPKRQNANNVDIKLPGLNEFECEIKSRPSDVLDSNKESDSKLSSEEIMVNFLNGKNIEEIEFHPVSTPIKTFKADEFHFGPNATPFSTPAKFDTSESLSTKAVFGDESSASYLERSYTCEISKSEVTSKEQDPMSTSFYQDKDDVEDSNPFDLNKVHVLPDNIEDFLAKPLEEFLDDTDKDSFFNDTISDLPEHDFASLDRNNLSGLQTQTQNTLANAFELHSQEVAKAFDEKIQEYPEDHNNVADALKSSTELPVSSEFQPVLSQLPQSLPPIHKEEPHFLLENSVTSHSPVSPQSPDIKVLIPPQLPTLAQTPSPELSPIPAQSHVFAESPVFTESVVSTKSVLSTESPVPEVLSVHTGAHVHVESPIIEIPPVHSESPVPSQSSIHSELHVSTHSPIPSESFIHFKSSVLPHSPIHLESQVSPQSPIHSESPIPPQSPIHLESPVPPQLPVHSETHVPPQSPIQSESPASPQSPIFSESPVPPQSPIHSETHVSPQSPIHSESPVPPQSPIHLESPIPPQSLIHSESPVLTQSPVPPRIPEPARSPSPVNASIDAQSISPVQSPISPQASSPIQFSAPLQFLSSSQFPSDGAHSSDIQAFNIQESQSFVSDQDNGVDVKQKSPEVLACRRYEIVLLKPEEELLIPVPISNTSDTLDVIPTSHSPVPSREIESPLEDITSSVKDSPPLASSPLDKVEDNNLDIMHEVVALVHETPRDISLLSNDDTLSSSQSKIETESVATTDINSFLERSLLPDVASPLSPNQQEDGIIFASPPITMESHDHVLEDVEVKSDVIAPEFPVQQEIVTAPVEAVVKSVASKKISGTPTKAKVGVTSATATAASKKPLPKVTAASTKPAVKSLVKTSAAVPPKAAPAKAALAKTSTTPVSSPKPLNKPSAKAPVTNGVTKAPLVTKTTSTISASAKPLPSKTTKPATTRTAVAPVAATTKPPASSTTARPSTLSSKTSTTSTTVKKVSVTSTVTNAKSTEKSTTSPKDSPKPRPTTASTGVTASARAKPAPIKLSTKTPESEKSVKEAANKQTALRAASAGTTKPAVRKSEPKMMSTTRTSLTKTTPTSLKGAGDAKKPQELIRHPVNKTKVRKIDSKETKVHENGVANELFTAELIKDASPIIENSQLLD